MPRVRIRFRKQGDARFISHLDLVRVMERAARRAGLPLRLSQGYNPRPKMAFASALALGTASDAEYLDLELVRPVPLEDVLGRLREQLPSGLRPSAAAWVPEQAPALMALVNAAEYEVEVEFSGPCPGRAELEQRLRDFVTRGGALDGELLALAEGRARLRLVLPASGGDRARPRRVAESLLSALGCGGRTAGVRRRELLRIEGGRRLVPWELVQGGRARG
ncbi:MAG: TIGR03936 family radical SAM-associated protein [Acetobacteraceae bacterium]|nr:TIGR03936 family radical SAM-associated protein [Acetobacteraceae bacterium]